MTRFRMVQFFLFALGAAVTVFWMIKGHSLGQGTPRLTILMGALCGISSLTIINLLLRWMRWHFLNRSVHSRIKTRESVKLYLSTLPLIFTPFYVGEMLRALILYRRYLSAPKAVFVVWLIERTLEVAVLGIFWFVAQKLWLWLLGECCLVLIVIWFTWKATRANQRWAGEPPVSYPLYSTAIMLTTGLSWILPIMALWGVVSLLGRPITISLATRAFVQATLLGAITSVPLGIGITGSTAIHILISSGVLSSTAIWSIALWRTGTAWFALALGAILLWRWRRQLWQLWRGVEIPHHFDALAPAYAAEIAEYMRERLLRRKVDVIHQRLATAGVPRNATGLDVGCGQGWYACEMAALGYRMIGVDASAGQIEMARAYAAERGLDVNFYCMSAAELVFADHSFEFVYSINVFHQVGHPADRQAMLEQVVRVLKPGGGFYFHEMNPLNPLFRFYLSYVFPLLKQIDEGDERWVSPHILPPVAQASWDAKIDFFTFLPDFLPARLLKALAPWETYLETSRWRRWSVHYQALLTKTRS